ncbi:TIGR03758 family integrating conjugative element protein [Pseudomonas aeruginosa]|uniref:TIGR03758 family integrating conjugative element protein n=1 Tax=Pseudomonas aeruginosa TaxID=287 RepID=UPI000BB963EB|nr:TIGR03758 family integrating conjugative element protein [Pseudomonas aeruginosa]MBP8440888.1 TIGR03758 family integrating conjugative element protein [Pseudomonas aeruginosa]MBP8446954.1 TIGR03758 family integrating conjugative element protein [Pseudomonas aeruginosa]MBP8470765.1 TIGR03758 family integrating conjugative element protein [Pseudomonas aeruginosa]MBP8482328.1 TIGR03758 family integrating conjugative element protein [Pseudomonas aeruginosa]MBP8527555.1 TIGR03758 family integrat
MTPSADQTAAFQANGGFPPTAVSTVVLSIVFAVLLLWGVWAMRTAYFGWAEQRLSQRQFLGVIVRFFAMYVVLTYLLLS